MDISKISYNDHTLFHMLRHFECINETARKCLLDRGYSDAAINSNLAIPGSKFHRSFATDIKTLVAQLANKEIIYQDPQGKYVEGKINFNKVEFPNGIGTKALVPIKEMDRDEAKNIVQKSNRGVLLNHAFVHFIPNEWAMTIVWKPQKNYDLLITVFPGLPTLPIPQKGMNKELFERSFNYWEERCFIALKKNPFEL